MPQAVLINGRVRDWSQIKINLLGVEVQGITEVNYKDKTEKENVYGAGNEPVGRGHGKREYEADISLYAEEVEAIEKVAPFGDITKIPPFPIVVSYTEGASVKTDIIQNCEFLENSRGAKTGDKSIVVKLPLIVAGIKRT